MEEQNFSNHVRWVPAYHFLTFGILGLNLVWRLVFAWHVRSVGGRAVLYGALVDVLLAIALLLVALYARIFALRVQDRVIRGEERERLGRLLPPELRARVAELTPRQLVALRFASDAELPALAAKVLDERLQDGKAIKGM